MNKLALLYFLVLPLLQATAQDQPFTYSRKNSLITLVNGTDTIKLKDYRTDKKNKIRNRKAIVHGETYTMSIAKVKGGVEQSFIDGQGVKQATVNLGNKNRYDITLADGTILDCNITGRTWTYKKDSKEVMRASMKRVNGKKAIVVTSIDPQVATPAVMLSCLERGTDKYVSSSTTAPIIITGAMLAIIRVAVSSATPDGY